MPFCPSCGTSADGKFCPKCGTAIGVAPGAAPGGGYTAPPPPPPPGYAPPPPGYQQPGYQPPPQQINAPGLTSNVAAMLCYLIPVVCPIIFLVVEPYKSDRKIRFDAFQSIFLWVALIVANIAVGIIAGFSYHLWFLYSIVRLGEFAVTIFMAFKAYQGEKFVLPVIGDLATKQA